MSFIEPPLRSGVGAFMLYVMKTLALVLFALFFVGCSEALDPDWEPVPTCVLPEATWSYDGDKIVCGPGGEPYGNERGCYWPCASFRDVCGTLVDVHIYFGVDDPQVAWDSMPENQCH